MEFDPGRWAANVTRLSERASLDSLDVDKAFKVAAELKALIGAWGVYAEVQLHIARLIVERDISPRKVAEIIETTMIRHRQPELLPDGTRNKKRVGNRGAYLVTSIKRELASKGIPWRREEAN
jgi:hypothetical protein